MASGNAALNSVSLPVQILSQNIGAQPQLPSRPAMTTSIGMASDTPKMNVAQKLKEVDWKETMSKVFSVHGFLHLLFFVCFLIVGHIFASFVKEYVTKVAKRIEKDDVQDKPRQNDENESVYLASVVMSSLTYYLIMISAAILAFHLVGISLTGIIAWIGVFGVIIGFALQGFLQDIVSGIIMACTGKFRVNDLISMGLGPGARIYRIDGFNLLHTRMRDMTTNSVATMSNRKVQDTYIANITKGGVYYLVYNVMAHQSNTDFGGATRSLINVIGENDIVRASGEVVSVGFVESTEQGSRLSLRVPILAKQFTYKSWGELSITIRDAITRAGLVLMSNNSFVFPPYDGQRNDPKTNQ